MLLPGQNEAGLGHYQVRGWRASMLTSLSMAARALLVMAKSIAAKGGPLLKQRC